MTPEALLCSTISDGSPCLRSLAAPRQPLRRSCYPRTSQSGKNRRLGYRGFDPSSLWLIFARMPSTPRARTPRRASRPPALGATTETGPADTASAPDACDRPRRDSGRRRHGAVPGRSLRALAFPRELPQRLGIEVGPVPWDGEPAFAPLLDAAGDLTQLVGRERVRRLG